MRNVIFKYFFSTIMITGLGFGLEDTGLCLGPIPVIVYLAKETDGELLFLVARFAM